MTFDNIMIGYMHNKKNNDTIIETLTCVKYSLCGLCGLCSLLVVNSQFNDAFSRYEELI
ncbi:607_t:CDS:2 [Diversispora eburnea]|uniref:607_t:CDS:1 n=1 Tax=Diversispora eburnea TaxID=1213867 RepID=A0A9N8Z5V5_9GLOM|nr:607_t:CDS:2 [Diversispora eburnea]